MESHKDLELFMLVELYICFELDLYMRTRAHTQTLICAPCPWGARSLLRLLCEFAFPACQWPTARSLETMLLSVTSAVSCPLFSSLVCRSSPVWFRVAVTWDGIKSAANCKEGRLTLRPSAQLAWPRPPDSPRCGLQAARARMTWPSRLLPSSCDTVNKCLRGSLWWEESGFQGISLLILRIN